MTNALYFFLRASKEEGREEMNYVFTSAHINVARVPIIIEGLCSSEWTEKMYSWYCTHIYTKAQAGIVYNCNE